ncbi:MAG: hypothetical protein MI924_09055 [Chloroflexales bacterium]|nr:hypothetical protein [Chloroflexales bacterium]
MNQIDSYIPTDLPATDLEALEIELAERLTRRGFIIGAGGLLGAAALGACADQPVATDQEADPTAAAAASSGETRVVEHALGEVAIPADPQRVITLHDIGLTTMALHLGFQSKPDRFGRTSGRCSTTSTSTVKVH